MDLITLAAAKDYVGETADSLGAVKGAPATIKSITEIDGGHRVTFEWTGTSGTKQTSTLDVMNGVDGIGITSVTKTKTEGLVDTYTITFTDGSTFNYEVTNGKNGKDGSGSSTGEENVIESIKVNGVAQTVAEDKSVDITVPTVDVDKNYVDTELTKKANTSDIPTKVSGLQNDSNYQTDTDVTTALTPYATKTYVGEQISNADHLKREIVTEIPKPETADKNTIYMLKIESVTGNDKYREYLLIDGTVQCVGDTSVDLTDYVKTTDVDKKLNNKANKTEIPTELPANGGNSATVNGHTVNADVPENAVFTDTVYDDTEVKESISVQSTEMMDIKMLGWSVPRECPVQNEMNKNQFVQKVGRVDLGSYKYSYSSSDGFYIPNFDSSKYGIANNHKNYSIGYTTCTNMTDLRQSTKGLFIYGSSFNIKDTSYTDASAFKSAMQGKYLYYELATPITTSIDGNEIGETVSDVRKETTVNFLNPTLGTITVNGITCTSNGDGTYTLRGTAGDNTAISIQGIKVDKQKKYKLVGCPSNGKDSTYHLVIVSLKTTNYSDYRYDYGDGTIVDNLQFEDYTINIDVVKGTPVNNVVFKPMLTTNLNATYDDFVPYTGDSGSLAGDVADLRSDVDGLKNETKATINDTSTTSTTETWSAKKINEKTAQNFDKRIILSVDRGTSGEYTDTANLNSAYGAYLYWASTAGQEQYSVGVILYVNKGWMIIPIKETDGGTNITFSINGSILTMTKSSSNFPSAGGVIALGSSI
mgnify:FL=1